MEEVPPSDWINNTRLGEGVVTDSAPEPGLTPPFVWRLPNTFFHLKTLFMKEICADRGHARPLSFYNAACHEW